MTAESLLQRFFPVQDDRRGCDSRAGGRLGDQKPVAIRPDCVRQGGIGRRGQRVEEPMRSAGLKRRLGLDVDGHELAIER